MDRAWWPVCWGPFRGSLPARSDSLGKVFPQTTRPAGAQDTGSSEDRRGYTSGTQAPPLTPPTHLHSRSPCSSLRMTRLPPATFCWGRSGQPAPGQQRGVGALHPILLILVPSLHQSLQPQFHMHPMLPALVPFGGSIAQIWGWWQGVPSCLGSANSVTTCSSAF